MPSGVRRADQSEVDWARAQAALGDEVSRVVALLRSVRRPHAAAVGRWDLAEVAMHLSQAWLVVPGLARDDRSGADATIPSLGGAARRAGVIGDLWDLGDATVVAVRSDPERDPKVLADRIELAATEYLASCSGRSPHTTRPWLVEGVTVRLPTLTCHLLNETIVHGRDIALADGRRWSIDRSHAAMVFDGFLIPVMRALGPHAMVDQSRAADVRARYDVRIRGGGRYHFVFDDGALSIDEPSSRRVDCHLSVDPVAFLLVAWGRMAEWGPIATGRLMAWGRKPWLGARLRGLMRNP